MTRTTSPGTDFLQLDPSSAGRAGLTAWLAGALRAAINDGRLGVGARLPSTRTLAAELGVSRGVAVQAYQQLLDEGRTVASRTRGTVVASAPARPASAQSVPRPVAVPDEPAIEIDLAPGLPDLSAFPRAAWVRAEREVLARLDAAELGYGDPRGAPALRWELTSWLARSRGVRSHAEGILVVAGVAQALALLARVLHARGTRAVAVEDPGSWGARDQLAGWGLNPVPVPVDDHGLDVGELRATRLNTVLVTPAHQFPTGAVLAPQRRRELVEWALRGGLVIEDDYDAEHRYDRAPVPALHSLAPDRVAYTGSASKTLAPGLRIGWLIPPPQFYDEIVEAKRLSDLAHPALPQLTLAQLIASGAFDRHLRLLRARHRARRNAMLAALAQHMPSARVHGVAAGLHLVITLPDAVDDTALVARARTSGLGLQPLSMHRHRPGSPGLVLGYAAHPPDRIHDAIHRIAQITARLT